MPVNNVKHTRKSFFLDLLFSKNSIPGYPIILVNTLSNELVYESLENKETQGQNLYCSIYDLPGYLETRTTASTSSFKLKIALLYDGYLLKLKDYKGYADFIEKTFDKRRQSRLRGLQNRLDHCLSPTYRMYYGPGLDKNEYRRLFDCLRIMIERRFAQKGESNYELPLLNYYQEIMYPLIIKKKACLFVIYDRNNPINISINFIAGKTLYPFNNSYDIDYSIFGLGHINMLKHIAWCYDHKFKLMDLGRGDYLHKRQWVDHKYTYKELIAFDSNFFTSSIKATSRALYVNLRYQAIYCLKKVGVHRLVGIILEIKYKLARGLEKRGETMVQSMVITKSEIPVLEDLVRIDHYDNQYYFLKKPVNDYLSKNRETVSKITVYTTINLDNIFYLIGNRTSLKILRVK